MPALRKPRGRRQSRPFIVHDYRDQPLTTALSRSHIVELFARRPSWTRAAIVSAVAKSHLQAGGLDGQRSVGQCVGEALHTLKRAGLINNEVMGVWRLVGKAPILVKASDAHDETAEDDENSVSSFDSLADEAAQSIEEKSALVVGEGQESVRVIFNPNDRRLAILEGRDRWECRISRADSEDLSGFSRPPVTGLIMLSHNAIALENMLQACLSLARVEAGEAPASGWFYTSPSAIKDWFTTFQSSLDQLSGAR